MTRPSSDRDRHARTWPRTIRGRILLVCAVACSVAGITTLGVLGTTGEPAEVGKTARMPVQVRGPQTAQATPTESRSPRGPVLDRAVPIGLRIRALGVRTRVRQLGLKPNGTVETPPDNRVRTAGWYRYSPTPGEVGPSVLLGHADSGPLGRGVFAKLSKLAKGDHVDILRADGTVAVFRVDRVGRYPMERFPVRQVYRDINYAGIRLITCDVPADAANVIVFASLASAHPIR
ncbi:MAG: sortase domain-containing protein [Streptosporangiales bacterium]